MMAPSICFDRGRPRLVVGSAGSARLRGAILQVVVNVVARGMNVHDAVDAPRLHLDDERRARRGSGVDVRGLDPERLTQWKARNLFFGGANAVEVLPDGSLPPPGTSVAAAPRSWSSIVVRRAEPADAAALSRSRVR